MKTSDAGMFVASTLLTTVVTASSFLGIYFLIAIPKEVKRLNRINSLRVLPKEQKEQVEEKPLAKAG